MLLKYLLSLAMLSLSIISLAAPPKETSRPQDHSIAKSILTELIKNNPEKIELPIVVSRYVVYVIAPLVKNRKNFAEYSLLKNNGVWSLIIKTLGYKNDLNLYNDLNPVTSETDHRLVYSTYKINFLDKNIESKDRFVIPSLKLSLYKEIFKNSPLQVSTEINRYFSDFIGTKPKDWILMQNELRSAFRADPFLHPYSPIKLQQSLIELMEKAKGQKIGDLFELSEPQKEIINQLLDLDEQVEDKKNDELRTYGLLMPVGTGKTIAVAKFLTALHESNKLKRPTKIVVVYENIAALEQSRRFFKQHWGLADSDFINWYGEEKKTSLSSHENFKILLATRSSYYANMEQTHNFIESQNEFSWFYIFDEAHHLGKKEGQFYEIFHGNQNTSGLNLILGKKDRAVLLTATPWHEEINIIQDYMNGNVAGAFYNQKEIKQLRTTTSRHEIMELSKLQLLRSINQGYSNPVETFIEHYASEEGETMSKILYDSMTELKSLEELSEQIKTLKSHITIYKDLIDQMGSRILKHRLWHQNDHALIYAPTIAHANIYAGLLERWFASKGKNNVEVKSFHSKLKTNQKMDVENWFIYEGNTYKHKYLFVVDSFREALDIGRVNLIINARPILEFRSLIQIFGRASRIFVGKTGMRILDFTNSFSKLMTTSLGAINFLSEASLVERGQAVILNKIDPEIEINNSILQNKIIAKDVLPKWNRQLKETQLNETSKNKKPSTTALEHTISKSKDIQKNISEETETIYSLKDYNQAKSAYSELNEIDPEASDFSSFKVMMFDYGESLIPLSKETLDIILNDKENYEWLRSIDLISLNESENTKKAPPYLTKSLISDLRTSLEHEHLESHQWIQRKKTKTDYNFSLSDLEKQAKKTALLIKINLQIKYFIKNPKNENFEEILLLYENVSQYFSRDLDTRTISYKKPFSFDEDFINKAISILVKNLSLALLESDFSETPVRILGFKKALKVPTLETYNTYYTSEEFRRLEAESLKRTLHLDKDELFLKVLNKLKEKPYSEETIKTWALIFSGYDYMQPLFSEIRRLNDYENIKKLDAQVYDFLSSVKLGSNYLSTMVGIREKRHYAGFQGLRFDKFLRSPLFNSKKISSLLISLSEENLYYLERAIPLLIEHPDFKFEDIEPLLIHLISLSADHLKSVVKILNANPLWMIKSQRIIKTINFSHIDEFRHINHNFNILTFIMSTYRLGLNLPPLLILMIENNLKPNAGSYERNLQRSWEWIQKSLSKNLPLRKTVLYSSHMDSDYDNFSRDWHEIVKEAKHLSSSDNDHFLYNLNQPTEKTKAYKCSQIFK